MDPKLQTTFIPKKPITSAVNVKSASPMGFILLISLVVFFASVLLAAGVFTYKAILSQSLESDKKTFEKSKDAFEPGTVLTYTRLSTKMIEGAKLLKAHTAPSLLFGFLSENTIDGVAYNSLTFQKGEPSTITLTGTARDYANIARQADVFGERIQYIKDPIFSSFGRDSNTGLVNFTFSASVMPELISYQKYLDLPSTTAAPEVPATTEVSTSTATTTSN